MLIYNPCDSAEESRFMFNGHTFQLLPNASQALEVPKHVDGKPWAGWEKIPVKALYAACMEQLGSLGIVLLSGVPEADTKLRERAEEVHELYLRDRFLPVLQRHKAKIAEHEAHGVVPPPDPPEVVTAKSRLKEWKLLVAGLLLCLLAPFSQAQTANFTYKRTLADGSNYVYCKINGSLGNPYGQPIAGAGLLTTTGASTTVTGSDAAGFSGLITASATRASYIMVSTDGGNTNTLYRVVTKTSNTQISIDTSVNWASPGFSWTWFDEYCGTTAADGWIACGSMSNLTFAYVGGSGTANVVWEARGSDPAANPIQIYPDNSSGAASRSYTAATIDNRTTFNLGPGVAFTGCRIGMKGTNPIVSSWIDRTSK